MKKIILIVSFTCAHIFLIAQVKSIVGAGKEIDPFHYSIVKSQTFDKAAVACANPIAANVGAVIMKQGGNAFDAAIAVNFALAVVYPAAGNIGGGGFLVARKSDGKSIALDYREMAPAKAFRDMYLDSTGKEQLNLSQFGHLSSGIPGTVAGLFAMHKYAKLPMQILIQPAIDLAENGFAISEREANSLNSKSLRESFIKNSTTIPVFVKDIKWKAGDTLIQKDLAETLKRIRDYGKKGFYEGKTAELIVAEMQKGNGIISLTDLKNYIVKERAALSFTYKSNTIIGMPPSSSGGIIVCQLMKMMEKRYLDGFQTARTTQLMIEAERRAFADRAEYMGDPDFWKVPIETLTSDAYVQQRMQDFDSTKATPSKNIKAGIIKESEQTTHISIIDQYGNMVSITTTLNNSYGSRTVVAGAGFIMNDEMDDFSVKPGVANMYGALGGEANAIQPGKRMLSAMSPTIVLDKNNKPFIIAGTPGGTTIPTSVFQTLINIIEFNMNATDAVNQPKFHHQWFPDEVQVEKTFSPDTRKKLEAMGYKIVEKGAIGRTEVIKILADGKRETAADKRGDDSVAGF
jgi:gamma-glutamyltranspeptidase/glutathione hydrolase